MPLRLEKPVQPSEDLAVDLTVLVESSPPYPSTNTSLGTARGELCYSSPYSDRLAPGIWVLLQFNKMVTLLITYYQQFKSKISCRI